jgi:LysM repeat protein
MAGGPPETTDDDDAPWTASAASAAAGRAALGGGPAAADPGPRARRAPEAEIEDLDHDEEAEPRRPARRPRAYDQHLGGTAGPDWERPRRQDAYPTIKTRVGMPNVPRIAVMAGLVLVLAVALVFLPTILNVGGTNTPAASGGPSAGVGTGPKASVAPTVPPAPTPAVYTIKKGETLSKIATAHGITMEELLAANPTIKNPDKISEGQQIILPVPSEAPPNEIDGSAAPTTP